MSNIELNAIDRQQRRFSGLSIATMVVSFVHMVAALSLFSDGSKLGNLAAFLMTGLVDGATWVITGYIDYARRRNLKRNRLVAGLLWGALAISFGLNLAYLLAHQPPVDKVPAFVSIGIAIVFSVFIPACIGVASLARGELEDDKTQHMQAAQPLSVAATLPASSVAAAPPHPQTPAAPQFATRVLSIRKPPSMTGRRRALPQPEYIEATTSRISPRAAEWDRRNRGGESYAAISASLGGSPSHQYISREVRKLRAAQGVRNG